MPETQLTFDDVNNWPSPPVEGNQVTIKPLNNALWTETKARLIQQYLRYFLFITKHGTYIDGFAGPQNRADEGSWAAKLVLEMEPKWLRNFFLCEFNRSSFDDLQVMVDSQPVEAKRRISTHHGDFNSYVLEVLKSGVVTEKEATFALLDQRTFECDWSTVETLAKHKTGSKIELFYFFPTGWLSRSISGLKEEHKDEQMQRWWGDESWVELIGKRTSEQADLMQKRIRSLGYADVKQWPIYERERGGGKVMYHMIHATDHQEAPKLMWRAYKNISSGALEDIEQFDLDLSLDETPG
ncbi:MAG: three-Cys-motif partner protein TcmP [Pseudohongiella nitratireducens]|nr:three-Cys-motif partner protein TcmP [Pseudohongiella nitratireducens]MDF1622488.1 three-Cys-motif partner protein TcmP [Pseudohongiella nitratireducens]